jgi:ubiquinone/menaquinone biosynthesis C-methylase UbiE
MGTCEFYQREAATLYHGIPLMQDTASHWDNLHQNPRFRPVYPSDHVVRFMMGSRPLLKRPGGARFLDIGVGAGRHAKLAADLGFTPFGIDISFTGLQHAQERLRHAGVQTYLAKASMLALPFRDGNFEVALSYGVFYYGTAAEMKRAIKETYRVLAPGGRAFVVLRTTSDCRFAKGEQIEPNTFRLTITETNEAGTIQHFLADEGIPDYFSEFSQVTFEKSETTFSNRTLLNSDWLITVEK